MKIIDCNNWVPHNKSNIPITDPLINAKGLFVFSNAGGVAWAYYNLSWFTKNYHYFYEDD